MIPGGAIATDTVARNTAVTVPRDTLAADARARNAEVTVSRDTLAAESARDAATDAKTRRAVEDVDARGAGSGGKAGEVAGTRGQAGAPPAARPLATGAKAKGKASSAAGHMGSVSFARILGAKLAGKEQKPDTHHVEKEAAAVKTAEPGAKKLVLKLAAPVSGDKKVLPGEDETDGKKKPTHAPAHDARAGARPSIVPAVVPALTVAIHAEKPAQSKEPVPAVAARAPHTAAPSSAVPAQAPKVQVVDLRRKAEHGRTTEEAAALLKGHQGLSADKDPAVTISPRTAAAPDSTATVSFKQAPPAAPAGQTPLERFREMAGNELVKATNMVLRDGGGEIRLVLKPESLGSVRVRMHIMDNAIEGKIVVDNQAVKQVIDGNLDSLMRALRAEGFQGASIQVSVGGQNADSGRQTQDERPEAVRRVSAQGFERNIPGVESLSLGDLLVNLFV